MRSTAILPMPSDLELQEMTERVLLDFNGAVQMADFGSFYSKISVPWQKQTSAEELQASFQGFIDKKINISPISSWSAVFTPKPNIRVDTGYNTLILMGYYETSPYRTKFRLHFIPDENQWRLSRIEVDTTPD